MSSRCFSISDGAEIRNGSSQVLQGGKRKVIRTQLKVIKADGSVEEYLHTKVMGSINNALGEIDQPNI